MSVTIINLPLAIALSGLEVVPIDVPNGDGTFTTKRTTLAAISLLPFGEVPFLTIGASDLASGRQLVATPGDLVLADGGAGATATLSLPELGAAGTFGDAGHTLTLTVDAKGRATGIASNPLAVENVAGAAPLASPTFTGTPTAPTTSAGDSSTTLATTGFVKAQGYVTGPGAAAVAPVQSVAGRAGAVTIAAADITDSTATGRLLVTAGSPSVARTALSAAATGANSDIVSLAGLTTALSVGQGGTGDTGTAWTSGSATVTSTAGTITSASGTFRYKKIGRSVFFQAQINITTNGTGSGAVMISNLPFTAASTTILAGRDAAISGKMIQGIVAGTTSSLNCYFFDGSYPGANGAVLYLSGVCEATT